MLASPDVVHAATKFSRPDLESSPSTTEGVHWGAYNPPKIGSLQSGSLRNNDSRTWEFRDQVRFFREMNRTDESVYLDVPRRNDMPIRCNMLPQVGGMVLVDLGEEWDDSWPCVAKVVEVCDTGYSLRIQLYRSECLGIHGRYSPRIDGTGVSASCMVRTSSHYLCNFSLQNQCYLSNDVKSIAGEYAVKEFVKKRFVF